MTWKTMDHDQADELRQLARQSAIGAPARPRLPLVVVQGAKEGVGTSTAAANLAVAFARRGRPAVLVDADLDRGGTSGLWEHCPSGSVLDVLSGRRTAAEVLKRGPSGIWVIAGSWADAPETNIHAQAILRLIAELEGLTAQARVAIIDAGSSRQELPRLFWQAASTAVVVTTAESASILEAYAAVKIFALDRQTPIHTLVNRASATNGEAAQARIANTCQQFLSLSIHCGGHLPNMSARGGQGLMIFADRSPQARTLDRLADVLATQTLIQRPSTNKRDALLAAA